MKLISLSEVICKHTPFLVTSLRRVAKKASVVNCVTSSKCMAFMVKQVNTAIQAFPLRITGTAKRLYT